jgi:large subunit ribosomal protein L33
MASAHGPRRIQIALFCSACGRRNYKSTRKASEGKSLQLSKFCNHCKRHTVHIEGK